MPPLDAVVGLGNPGRKYQNNYHNLGFWAVDTLHNELITSSIDDPDGHLARTEDSTTYLGKPGCYVNQSGQVVSQWSQRYDWDPGKTLIVYDDFSLDVGETRLRPSGRDGGHNGLADVLTKLETNDVPRLRIGIGPVPSGMDPADLVLSDVTSEDREVFNQLLDDWSDFIRSLPEQSWQEAMSEWNGREYNRDG